MSNGHLCYFPYLRGCSIKCSYISAQFNRQQNIFTCNKMVIKLGNGNKIWTLLLVFYLYLCHLLEFTSHITGERQSTEIANDNSSNCDHLLLCCSGQHTYTEEMD